MVVIYMTVVFSADSVWQPRALRFSLRVDVPLTLNVER